MILKNKLNIVMRTFTKKLLIKIVMKPYIVWIFYTLILMMWNIGTIYATERTPDHIPEIFEKERQEWYKVNHDENHGRWSKSEQVFHRYRNPQDMSPNLVESDGYRDNDNNWVKNSPLRYHLVHYYEKDHLLKAWQKRCAIADGNQTIQPISHDVKPSLLSGSDFPVQLNVDKSEAEFRSQIKPQIQTENQLQTELENQNNNDMLKAMEISEHLYNKVLSIMNDLISTNIEIDIRKIVHECLIDDSTQSFWKCNTGENVEENNIFVYLIGINHIHIIDDNSIRTDIEKFIYAHINTCIQIINVASVENKNPDLALTGNEDDYNILFQSWFKKDSDINSGVDVNYEEQFGVNDEDESSNESTNGSTSGTGSESGSESL